LERQEKKVRERVKKIARSNKRSFVFVDTTGKLKGITSRAKGYVYYVDSKARLRRVKHAGEKVAATHRIQDYDLNRDRRKSAVEKFNKKWKWEELLATSTIKPKNNPYDSLGEIVNRRVRKLTETIGSKQPVRVQMVVKLSNGRIVRTNIQVGQAQLQPLLGRKKGASKIIQRAAWKAVSTELSLEDMVTAGSRRALRSRSEAKREEWGKMDYETVRIMSIEIKTYYAKGRFR
jgi:hypothetical protein